MIMLIKRNFMYLMTNLALIEQKTTSMGIQWLAEWLNARYGSAACVVIDGRNSVDFLIDKISGTWKYKGSIVKPSGKDVIAAASQMVNEINEQTVTWYKYQEVLSESATTSTKRAISGGWGFGGENANAIEAAALAYVIISESCLSVYCSNPFCNM